MGKKEKLQKELDLLLEKMRFWRYTLLAVISAIVGMAFSVSQGKIEIGSEVTFFSFAGFVVSVIAVKRLSSIDKEYRELLEELEKVD